MTHAFDPITQEAEVSRSEFQETLFQKAETNKQNNNNKKPIFVFLNSDNDLSQMSHKV